MKFILTSTLQNNLSDKILSKCSLNKIPDSEYLDDEEDQYVKVIDIKNLSDLEELANECKQKRLVIYFSSDAGSDCYLFGIKLPVIEIYNGYRE